MIANMSVLGNVISMEREITKVEIENAFRVTLEEEGYQVSNIQYDAVLKSEWEGCYTDECRVTKAIFNGMNVEVKKKANQKVKK